MSPRIADALAGVEDDERNLKLLQMVPHREPGLAATNHDDLEALGWTTSRPRVPSSGAPRDVVHERGAFFDWARPAANWVFRASCRGYQCETVDGRGHRAFSNRPGEMAVGLERLCPVP